MTEQVLEIIKRHCQEELPDRIPGIDSDPFLAELYEDIPDKETLADVLLWDEWVTPIREQILGWCAHAKIASLLDLLADVSDFKKTINHD